ncbi:MAG: transcription antitermination factor NusB [Planctomycetota bacterium]|nr:transcription antitermination factor NusB [Planctomycetota bacterium]
MSARSLALRALVALHRDRGARLRSELGGRELDGRDAAFAFELAHGVTRRERLLDHVLLGVAHRGLPKAPALRVALRRGVYQLLFVPGMPAHAAVHETVELVRQNKGFANAVLRKLTGLIRDRAADASRPRHELPLSAERSFELPSPLPEGAVDRLAVVHSLPDWLARRVHDQHGDAGLAQLAASASATPAVHLRARGSVDELAARLRDEGVGIEPAEGGALLRWVSGASPFATTSFRDGAFVVQDPTAVEAAAALPCQTGDTVIDLCAAPGTKTTYLADRVGAVGRVYAYDPDERRRQRIRENVVRLRQEAVVDVVEDAAALEVADGVLADVPCSNTGVLGRRVEARGRITPEVFDELPKLQREILDRAVLLTRPGGHVVYSTCSVDREENEAVVAAALAAHEGLELCSQQLSLPLAGKRDGGFFALLRRGG